MSVKLLTEQCLEILSLKGGCTGSSEATLVEMPRCWKSLVTAHLIVNGLLHDLKVKPKGSNKYMFLFLNFVRHLRK